MTLTTFEIGTKVKVNTPEGIIDGEIAYYYKGTYTNQFAVKFKMASSNVGSMTLTFSKKTGLPYGDPIRKDAGYKIL